jgi:hypothetical protein
VLVVRIRLASDQQVTGNLLIGGRGEEENALVYCLGGTAGARLRPFQQYFMSKEARPVDPEVSRQHRDQRNFASMCRPAVALTRSPTVLADACSLKC